MISYMNIEIFDGEVVPCLLYYYILVYFISSLINISHKLKFLLFVVMQNKFLRLFKKLVCIMKFFIDVCILCKDPLIFKEIYGDSQSRG